MLINLLDRAKAVLFDFDGVLVDSEPIYYQSYNIAFKKRGHSIKEEDYWEYWSSKGEGIPGEVKRYNLEVSPEEIKIMYAERCANYTAFCEKGAVSFFPGMLENLLALKEKGMSVAVASSSFEKDIITIFEKVGHAPPPCIIVGRGAGLRPKPHPDIFIHAAGALEVEPSHCLVVEDAHKGLESAQRAGMKCVILKNRLNQKLDYPGADDVIPDHAAFAEVVGQWKGRKGN